MKISNNYIVWSLRNGFASIFPLVISLISAFITCTRLQKVVKKQWSKFNHNAHNHNSNNWTVWDSIYDLILAIHHSFWLKNVWSIWWIHTLSIVFLWLWCLAICFDSEINLQGSNYICVDWYKSIWGVMSN